MLRRLHSVQSFSKVLLLRSVEVPHSLREEAVAEPGRGGPAARGNLLPDGRRVQRLRPGPPLDAEGPAGAPFVIGVFYSGECSVHCLS